MISPVIFAAAARGVSCMVILPALAAAALAAAAADAAGRAGVQAA